MSSNNSDASKYYRSIKSQQQSDNGDSRRDRRDMDRDRDRDMDGDMRMVPPPGFSGGAPGMGQMPRTAPPNFTPEAPGMERGQFFAPGGGRGPEEFGFDRRGRDDFRVRPREIQRCLFRFTFIWLINGNSFWFYPTFVGRQFVQGFRWRRNRWEFETINLRRILFFRCF